MKRLFHKLENSGREYFLTERVWLHVIWFILMIPCHLLALLGGACSLLAMYPVTVPKRTKELKYKPGKPIIVTKDQRKAIKKELLTKKKKNG